jgi:hypothetical protein
MLLLVDRAALGLQRNGHRSPVEISLDLKPAAMRGRLAWPGMDMRKLDQHDHHRITEDGAEAVVLALAHRHRGWRVVRRMQREEQADWLLEETAQGSRQMVALEVSGVDRGRINARLAEKLVQVSRCEDVDQRWAGVAGFEEPAAALRSVEASRR